MQSIRAAALATAAAIALCSARAQAGGAAPARSASPAVHSPCVVVLDVARVFKNHDGFKRRMDELRQEREGFEKEFLQDRQAVLARGAKLSEYKSGSAEYKQIEARMARELAELRVKAVAKNGDILEREGKIYFETYQDIVTAVAELAEKYNLSLVARYDSEATDPQDRGSILKAIARDVVYQRNLDITTMVIQRVNTASLAVSREDNVKISAAGPPPRK